MCPTIYSMSSLRVCGKIEPQWEYIVITSNRICWVYSDYILGYILKEISMSGSNPWWLHCKHNCKRNQGFLSESSHWIHSDHNCERTQSFHSESGHWLLWCFLCKSNQHVPPVYIVIKVVNTFGKNSAYIHWFLAG